MSSQSPSTTRLEDLMNRVFCNDLLRERILELAINEDNKLSGKTIRTCRLVHRSWLVSISKCLRKLRKPLFTLTLSMHTKYNYILERFCPIILNSPMRHEDQFPPIHLSVQGSYYRTSTITLQNVADWISRLQCNLVMVSISLLDCSDEKRHQPVTMSNVNFPILRNLHVGMEDCDENETASLHMTNLVQLILSGCQDLKHLNLCGDIYLVKGLLPVNFENLRMPPTLTKLQLQRGLNSNQLMGLTTSALPKLTTLTLPITTTPLEDNLVLRVLNRFRDSLKHLILVGPNGGYLGYGGNNAIHPTYIQLPRMKSLETLEIRTISIRWPQDSPTSEVVRQIPALQKITLGQQNRAKLKEWMDGPQLRSVVNVHVDVTCIDEPGIINFENAGLLREFPAVVLRAFPNFVKLNLDFYLHYVVIGLPYVFASFTHLEQLELYIRSGGYDTSGFSKCISAFLGIPLEWATALLATEESWDRVFFADGGEASIKNMTGLRKLRLGFVGFYDAVPVDSVFHFGLMNMPNLEEVYLDGGVTISGETANKWRKGDRMLKISE